MRKYIAEVVGTFVLVFGGVGSAVLAGSHIGFVGVAFAFGLSLLAMVYTIGPISGCHINPAVTLGVLLAKKIDVKDAVIYMFAQVVGAIVAAGLIVFVATHASLPYNVTAQGLGANGFGLHSPGGLRHGGVVCGRSDSDDVSGADGSGFYGCESAGGFCGFGDRVGADADPPGGHSDHEYFGESGTKHRVGCVCGRLGVEPAVAIYCGAVRGRRGGCGDLQRDSPAGCGDFHAARRTGASQPASGAGKIAARTRIP